MSYSLYDAFHFFVVLFKSPKTSFLFPGLNTKITFSIFWTRVCAFKFLVFITVIK